MRIMMSYEYDRILIAIYNSRWAVSMLMPVLIMNFYVPEWVESPHLINYESHYPSEHCD